MPDYSLTLVLQFKTSKIVNDMAKIQLRYEKTLLLENYFYDRAIFAFLGVKRMFR